MKLKSYAMLAMSGLLAGSIAYIAPAMADYTNNNSQSMQPANSTNSNTNSPNLMNPNTNVGAYPNSNQTNTNPNNPDNNMPNNNEEQGSPDTATGDDDY